MKRTLLLVIVIAAIFVFVPRSFQFVEDVYTSWRNMTYEEADQFDKIVSVTVPLVFIGITAACAFHLHRREKRIKADFDFVYKYSLAEFRQKFGREPGE